MAPSSAQNNNASYTAGDSSMWTTNPWKCSQCGQTVMGSHICHSTPYQPLPFINPLPTIPLSAEEARELLELIRELHSVIFRDRIARDVDPLRREGEEDEE